MAAKIGRLLGVGTRADVFEWGERAIKLYRAAGGKEAAFREAAIQAAVESMGVPVPAVHGVQRVEDRWGVIFDRIQEISFAEQMRARPETIPAYIERIAQLHRRIHAHAAPQFAGLNARLKTRIAAAAPIAETQKRALLEGLSGMADSDRLCHGDFHPLNILGEPGQPIVIDWPDACRGDPAADVCRSYLIMRLHAEELAAPYLDAYCDASGLARDAIMRWMPYVAAARLTEAVEGEAPRLFDLLQASGHTP